MLYVVLPLVLSAKACFQLGVLSVIGCREQRALIHFFLVGTDVNF